MELFKTRKGPLKIHLFLTHFHWDHVQGLPFFGPAYSPANDVTIYASSFVAPLLPSITAVMSHPHFPIAMLTDLPHIKYKQLGEGPVSLAGVEILPFQVNHPQGSCGYQISNRGARILFVPDREGGMAEMDAEIRRIANGADLLIHDSQYTPEEYLTKKGWGHSTYVDVACLAQESSVGQLVLFHHDPDHNDEAIDSILQKTRFVFPQTQAATEGMHIDL